MNSEPYDLVYQDNFGEIIVPVHVPENWDLVEDRYILIKIEAISVLTDRGIIYTDIIPDIDPFPIVLKILDFLFYNETFRDDEYHGDIGTLEIVLDYQLSKRSILENLSICFSSL